VKIVFLLEYFRFWEIKSVLSVGPLKVFTFFYVVVPEIFKFNFKTASMKILNNCAVFEKAVLESMFRLIDVCWKSIGGFPKATCGTPWCPALPQLTKQDPV
jgi:hypothetical protein